MEIGAPFIICYMTFAMVFFVAINRVSASIYKCVVHFLCHQGKISSESMNPRLTRV
jgi:hypothetical protein